MVTAELLEPFKVTVLIETKEHVQHCNTLDKLTNILLEYQTPQRVNAQGQQPQRAAVAPTESNMPTWCYTLR